MTVITLNTALMKSTYIKVLFFLTIGSFSTQVHAQIGNLLKSAKDAAGSLTDKVPSRDGDNLDISKGLKEALNEGVDSAVTSLSAKDGYKGSAYKILIPEDARKVVSTLKRVPGFRDVEDKLINKMNEAAEIAAKEATPIFVSAIKGMTVKDAKGILFGEDNAATMYLDKTTRTSLYDKFMPIIQSALKQVDATKYWNSVVKKYNSIPLTKKMNPDLDDHVNDKALDGLFGLISVKELGIRKDVNQRTSPVLQDVFSRLD